MCDLAAVVARLYAGSQPAGRPAVVFSELILLAAAAIGVLSLVMIPVVHRLRRIPPPRGFVVFGACAAMAPILAVLLRFVR